MVLCIDEDVGLSTVQYIGLSKEEAMTHSLKVTMNHIHGVHVFQAAYDLPNLWLCQQAAALARPYTHKPDTIRTRMGPQKRTDASMRHPLANQADGEKRGNADEWHDVLVFQELPHHDLVVESLRSHWTSTTLL
jgi:hypothetical protein